MCRLQIGFKNKVRLKANRNFVLVVVPVYWKLFFFYSVKIIAITIECSDLLQISQGMYQKR